MKLTGVLLQVVLLGQLSKDSEMHFGAFEIAAGAACHPFYPMRDHGMLGSPTWLARDSWEIGSRF